MNDQSPSTEYSYPGQDDLFLLEKAVHYSAFVGNLFKRVLKHVPAQEPQVMDFGTGIGTVSIAFHQQTGIKPVGVEIDPVQHKIILERGFECHLDIEDVPKESIDLIISSNVLEHIEENEGLPHDMLDRLRPGGVAAFYVPAFQFLWSKFDERVGHHRRYTVPQLRQLMEQAGFDILEAHYQDSVGFVLALLYKWIGDKEGRLDPDKLVFYDNWLLPISLTLDKVCKNIFGKNVFIVGRKNSR